MGDDLATPGREGPATAPQAPGAEGDAVTLQAACARMLARDPDQPAIEFEGRWTTWGEVRRVADRVRALVRDSGAAPDAPVAFAPRNHPASVAALIGLLADGRTIRMVYAFQSSAGIARDIGKCEAPMAVIAAQDSSDELIATLRDQGIAAIALRGMEAEPAPGCERVRRPQDTQSASPRIEILTSGTTGPPKRFAIGYELIEKHMLGGNLMYAGAPEAQAAPPVLLFFPLGNISGIYSTLPALARGMRVVLLERFTVAGWHDHMLRYRPQQSGLPPAGVQMVLDADIPPEDLASVRTLGAGAAPLDPTVQRAFEQRYGIPILLSYGATEFGGPVAAMTPDLHAEWGEAKFGSVGRPFAGARLRVIDPDTGVELGPGQEGRLEVMTPRIGPEWIRTSDIAVIDADGFLFHRGRADGAIMRGGFKLLPETIERALGLHPAVAAAAVVGVEDRRLGQAPAAAVQLRRGMVPPSVAELEAHLRQQVLATHIPAHWRFVDGFPMTPSLKIDRPAVARLFAVED